MADTDDIREGASFGLSTPANTDGFYLKGINNSNWGLKNRMSRIFNQKSGNTVMLAFDHGFLMGPTSGLERVDLDIAPLVEHADCIMGTRGMIRSSIPVGCTKPVCLRTDTGTTILTEMNHNVLIAEEEAIRMANDTQYGLATAIWTENSSRVHRVASQIDAGIIWVNSWFLRDLRTPFGGMGTSGIGREGGVHSLEFYTELKNVCVKL